MREKLIALSESLLRFEATMTEVECRLKMRQTIPATLVCRLGSYHKMCETLRDYIREICNHLAQDDYDEVVRLSSLARGISLFVLEDSKAILNLLCGVKEEGEVLYN